MKKHHEKESAKERRAEHYSSANTDDKLIINLRDMSHVMRFLYEGKGSQKRILIVLMESGKITQRELTERLGIKPGSVSEVVAKLEKDGYITKTESETDRRTTDIELTETGLKLASETTLQRKKRHEEMFSSLTDEEKSTLLSLLEKVNRDWESRYHKEDGEQGPCRHHHKGRGHHGRMHH